MFAIDDIVRRGVHCILAIVAPGQSGNRATVQFGDDDEVFYTGICKWAYVLLSDNYMNSYLGQLSRLVMVQYI